MNTKRLVLLFFILFTFTYLFAQEEEQAFDWSRPLLGKKAPELAVKEWLTEKPDTKGKFVILDFWSTSCGPCVRFTPHMNEFARKFRKKAVFIAIALQSKASIEKNIESLKKAMKAKNEEYVPIKFYQATDPQNNLFDHYGNGSIPLVVIIDPEGIVRWQGNPHGEFKTGKGALTEKVIQDIMAKYKKK